MATKLGGMDHPMSSAEEAVRQPQKAPENKDITAAMHWMALTTALRKQARTPRQDTGAATQQKSHWPDLTALISWMIFSDRTAVAIAAKRELLCSQTYLLVHVRDAASTAVDAVILGHLLDEYAPQNCVTDYRVQVLRIGSPSSTTLKVIIQATRFARRYSLAPLWEGL
jgi:hypothetical protein